MEQQKQRRKKPSIYKNKVFPRLSDAEYEYVLNIADELGTSINDAVRMMVNFHKQYANSINNSNIRASEPRK